MSNNKPWITYQPNHKHQDSYMMSHYISKVFNNEYNILFSQNLYVQLLNIKGTPQCYIFWHMSNIIGTYVHMKGHHVNHDTIDLI